MRKSYGFLFNLRVIWGMVDFYGSCLLLIAFFLLGVGLTILMVGDLYVWLSSLLPWRR